jgi:valyl-tRNA synthetase
MVNIRDWCISRQLWWGHQIPVWYCQGCGAEIAAASEPTVCDKCGGSSLLRDPDVLDTWFSSWLWTFSPLGWPDKTEDLERFHPTSVLVTAADIIFFWVARMVMASYEFLGEKPFGEVLFTGIVRDGQGRKMSKSLGNSPDPIDLMDRYGADGLRFGLMRIAPVGSDLRFDESSIEEGRNFANKLYNACRFRQMAGGGCTATPDPRDLPPYHVDILSKLDDLAEDLDAGFAEYRFGEIAQRLHEFLWSEFCDKFLEAVKLDLRDGAPDNARTATLATFDAVMSRYLQLLSPYMPHITEELSARMGYADEGEFVMNRQLPDAPLVGFDTSEARAKASAIYETAGRLRNLKTECNVATRRDVRFIVRNYPAWLDTETRVLAMLAGAAAITLDPDYDPPKGTPAAVTPCGEIYLPLEGLVDVEAERTRLGKEIAKIRGEVAKCEGKLDNPGFIDRAPPEVVDQEKARLEEWNGKLDRLQAMLDALS